MSGYIEVVPFILDGSIMNRISSGLQSPKPLQEIEGFSQLVQDVGAVLLGDLIDRGATLPDTSRLISRYRFSIDPPSNVNTGIHTDIDRALAAIGCNPKDKVGTLCFSGLEELFWKGNFSASNLFDLATSPILPLKDYKDRLANTSVTQPENGQVIVFSSNTPHAKPPHIGNRLLYLFD